MSARTLSEQDSASSPEDAVVRVPEKAPRDWRRVLVPAAVVAIVVLALVVRFIHLTALGFNSDEAVYSGQAGSLAGVLVAPSVFLHPNNMDGVFVFGFTAAVIGGLDSPVGAIVGGLGLGVLLSCVASYFGGDLQTLSALAVLVFILMVKPNGLFTTTATRRV